MKLGKRDGQFTKRRAETRSNCYARIGVALGKNLKYAIHDFVEEHNNPLQLSETTHMLSLHRKIMKAQAFEIDVADSAGLRQKEAFWIMSTQAGHVSHVGYTRLDAKNYLKAKRQRSMMYGDVGCLMQYFQQHLLENPSFFHAH